MATTLEQRIDRLESIEAIRGIVSRYPLCLDARDIDGVVALFVEDVRAYPGAERGRGPLHEHYTNLCKGWGVTCHVNSGNAVFDFIDDDHAEGHLYCRAEHEIGEQWVDRHAPLSRPLRASRRRQVVLPVAPGTPVAACTSST